MVTIEAHELQTRHGLWCPACHHHTLTEVDVVMVTTDLTPIAHATGSQCRCGWADTVRT